MYFSHAIANLCLPTSEDMKDFRVQTLLKVSSHSFVEAELNDVLCFPLLKARTFFRLFRSLGDLGTSAPSPLVHVWPNKFRNLWPYARKIRESLAYGLIHLLTYRQSALVDV